MVCGVLSRDSSKNRTASQRGAGRIIVVKEAARDLAGGVQTRDDFHCLAQNLRLRNNLDSTESKGHSSGNDVGINQGEYR
jgi:hypothetical protein